MKETKKRKESFNDLADALRWLADGGEIINNFGYIIKIINNKLMVCNETNLDFKIEYDNFQEVFSKSYRPNYPQEWYEKPFEPCFCWVYDGDEVAQPLIIVKANQKEGAWHFLCISGESWNYAIPLSNEEMTRYTFKGDINGG